MGKRSFTLNPENCIVKFGEADSKCYFDSWSIHHFYYQGFFYIIFHHFLKIKSIKGALFLLVLLTVIHGIEEYFGNTRLLSLEGIFIDYLGPIVNPKIDIRLRGPDNDYLQNSIGDVLSGFIATVLIILYWIYYKRLPYFYLYFIIIIFGLLLSKSYLLYPDNNLLKR